MSFLIEPVQQPSHPKFFTFKELIQASNQTRRQDMTTSQHFFNNYPEKD
jgi:hypothetical protein